VKRFFFLLNAAFAMAILDLISRVHLASLYVSIILLQNNASWQQLAHEPLVGLFSEYMALVSELSSVVECKFKDINDEILACLQQKLELQERKHHKWSNVDESIFTQPKTRKHNGIIEENNKHCTSQHDGYAVIGIWNSNSIRRFKGMKQKILFYSFCIILGSALSDLCYSSGKACGVHKK
jgi:hypothetical protein